MGKRTKNIKRNPVAKTRMRARLLTSESYPEYIDNYITFINKVMGIKDKPSHIHHTK